MIYLAGPIRGCSDIEAKGWRAEARELLGGRVIDPMDRDYRGHEFGREREIVENDLADIQRAWALLVWYPYPSTGTAMEIAIAKGWGKLVIVAAPCEPGPWVRYHADHVVTSVTKACRLIEHLDLRG